MIKESRWFSKEEMPALLAPCAYLTDRGLDEVKAEYAAGTQDNNHPAYMLRKIHFSYKYLNTAIISLS